MMASIGLVGQHFIKIPLFGLDKVPSGVGAFFDPTGFGGFFFLLCACGPFELAWRQEEWREPGNYGNPFGVDMYTTDMRNKEISNGRMAMISVVGIWAAELATGKDAMQQFGLAAVAVAAEGAIALSEEDMPPPPAPFNPAEQIGAIAPLGYFDPMGFTTVGDEEGFRRLRECELKHGRVAMMASIGLVGQHFIKIPLFGLDKVPSGIGAFFDPTGFGGFFFLLCACGPFELAWRQEEGREPGNYGSSFGVDMYTTDMRNKEISNGRMAMISVAGIWAAELATGRDAIQQFGFDR